MLLLGISCAQKNKFSGGVFIAAADDDVL